MFDSEDNA